MKDVFSIGETMVIFQANQFGKLEDIPTIHQKIGGAESNVLIGLARLGHDVSFISQVGNDPFGKRIIKAIRAEGVDVSHVKVVDDAPTGLLFKETKNKRETHVYYYRSESAASNMTVENIPFEQITKAKYIHLTGITPAISLSCREMIFKVLEVARAHEVPIIFDPNVRFKLWEEEEARAILLAIIEQSDYILTGISEAQFLLGTTSTNYEDICRNLTSRENQVVVVKNGADPTAYSYQGVVKEVPVPPVADILDPVGAGDAFAAGFIHGLLTDQSLDTCVAYGNALGGCVIQQFGDIEGLPNLEEFASLWQADKNEDVLR